MPLLSLSHAFFVFIITGPALPALFTIEGNLLPFRPDFPCREFISRRINLAKKLATLTDRGPVHNATHCCSVSHLWFFVACKILIQLFAVFLIRIVACIFWPVLCIFSFIPLFVHIRCGVIARFPVSSRQMLPNILSLLVLLLLFSLASACHSKSPSGFNRCVLLKLTEISKFVCPVTHLYLSVLTRFHLLLTV